MTEAWLKGPVDGVPPLLQPVAHALLNAAQQLEAALAGLSTEDLHARPGNAASIEYHVRHALGSLDRLFTYARGEQLSDVQRESLVAEKEPDSSADAGRLMRMFEEGVQRALDQLRATEESDLTAPREVGRLRLPSTVLGLLFHGGEHAVRHVGQVVTTAKVVAAPRS